MKINITVDVDYIDEEGNIDEEVKASIMDGVKSAISRDCLSKVEKEASKSIEKAMDVAIKSASEMVQTRAKEILDEWLKKDVVVTDEWGDDKTRDSIYGLIKKTFDGLATKYVDRNGNFTDKSYNNTPVLQWLTKDKVESLANGKIKELSKEIDAKIEKYINAGIRERVSDKFAEMVINTAQANHRLKAIELTGGEV